MTIHKIVITGGPCSGKTTALNCINNALAKEGYKVLFIPQIAEELILGGLTPSSCKTNLDYHRCLMKLQLYTEQLFAQGALTMREDHILIVCDQGTMDNKAFMTDLEFGQLCEELNTTESALLDRYEAVFHLATAAKGALQAYTLSDKVSHTDTPELAAAMDDKILAAWARHPHRKIITSTPSFEDKLQHLVCEIMSFLKEQEPLTEHASIGQPSESKTIQEDTKEEALEPAKNKIGDHAWWFMQDDTLTIGGEGDILVDKSFLKANDYPWQGASTIIVEKGITRIRKSTFSFSKVKKVILPDGYQCIETDLFRCCKNLTSITIPDTVNEIKAHAFEECNNLTQILLPKNLKTIGSWAFFKTGLKTIELPEGLISIGEKAFASTPLTEITIPESVTEVKDAIFTHNSLLHTVKLAKGHEDLPVFQPRTPEKYLQKFAFLLFNARNDVLEEPTDDPAQDRYTALCRLLDCMKQYFHVKTEDFMGSDSYATKGYAFICYDIDVDVWDDCYDGGCGPSYDTIRNGVSFQTLTDEQFKQKQLDMQLVPGLPFRLWRNVKNPVSYLFDHPCGLRDRFWVQSHYPLVLSEVNTGENRVVQKDIQKARNILGRGIPFADEMIQTAANHLFGNRSDIFLVPQGTPQEDRFQGLYYLLSFINGCYNGKKKPELKLYKGIVSYILDSWEASCYDGGGHNEPDIEVREVSISIITRESAQAKKEKHPENLRIGKATFIEYGNCILEQPFGLKDSFVLHADNLEAKSIVERYGKLFEDSEA